MNPPYTVLFHFSFCETWILGLVTLKLDGRTDFNIDVTVKSSQLAVALLLTQVAFESPVVSHINNYPTRLNGPGCWSTHQMRYFHPMMRD